MIFGVTAKKLISHDDVASGGSLWKCFDAWTKGLMSFPICVPGTAFYKCMQVYTCMCGNKQRDLTPFDREFN